MAVQFDPEPLRPTEITLPQPRGFGIDVNVIPKLTLLSRLEQAGLLSAAINTLKTDPVLYEKWVALPHIDITDPTIKSFLTSIGGDVNTLLSPIKIG